MEVVQGFCLLLETYFFLNIMCFLQWRKVNMQTSGQHHSPCFGLSKPGYLPSMRYFRWILSGHSRETVVPNEDQRAISAPCLLLVSWVWVQPPHRDLWGRLSLSSKSKFLHPGEAFMNFRDPHLPSVKDFEYLSACFEKKLWLMCYYFLMILRGEVWTILLPSPKTKNSWKQVMESRRKRLKC